MPLALKFAKIPLRLSPQTNLETVGAKLVAAGLTQRLSPGGFLAIKGGLTVGGCLVGLVLGGIASPVSGLFLTPILGVVGFIGSEWFLTLKIRNRRDAVRADLPDALDLLAVSVEAGLGFDRAVTQLTEHMDGPLIDEFALTLNEMRVGEARPVALRKMAERVDAA